MTVSQYAAPRMAERVVYMRFLVTGGTKHPTHGGVKSGAVEDFIVWWSWTRPSSSYIIVSTQIYARKRNLLEMNLSDTTVYIYIYKMHAKAINLCLYLATMLLFDASHIHIYFVRRWMYIICSCLLSCQGLRKFRPTCQCTSDRIWGSQRFK
jgi:hypothetical protein